MTADYDFRFLHDYFLPFHAGSAPPTFQLFTLGFVNDRLICSETSRLMMQPFLHG
jgi:hypothetical protein